MLTAVALLGLLATCGGGDTSEVAEVATTIAEPTSVPTREAPALPKPTPSTLADPAESVESDDGLVTLEIPAGALPPGVSAADLSVSRLAPEETSVTFKGESPIAAYALRPDGVQFAEPVRLTVTIPDGLNVAPVVVLVVGERLEIVPVLEYRLDGESGKGTVLAEIDHFSGLVIGPEGPSGLNL